MKNKESKGLYKSKPNSINTIEDVYHINGTTSDKVIPFKNPIDDDQRSTNAGCIIKQIIKAYNGDVILDWNDFNQPKYALYFNKAHGGGWVLGGVYDHDCHCLLGAGFYFASREQAREAYTKFKVYWDEYLPK